MARNPNGAGRDVEFTDDQKTKYLERLSKTGLRVASALDIGFSFATVWNHRKTDSDFSAGVDAAMQEYRDRKIEAEVHRRAIEGVSKNIYHLGVVVGQEIIYSDRMLELLAKRHIPEYRDKQQIDVNLSGGVMIVPGVILSPDEWEGRVNANGNGGGQVDAANERHKLLPSGGNE